MSQSKKFSYLLDWSICVDCSILNCCTIPRRFSNPSFKFVRNVDSDVPFAFVVGIVDALVVAQIATKTKINFAILLFLQCSK